MKYADSDSIIKDILWHSVTLPIIARSDNPFGWCEKHISDGRFSRRKITEYQRDRSRIEIARWSFEQEKDAVLFALKFK